MAVLSCLNYKTVPHTCIDYVHPWTDSCRDATLGLLFHALQDSFRTYATLYIATAILKRKKPSKKLLKDTILAILQSTAFLTTHSYGFSTVLCTIRRFTGSFNVLSVAFLPAYLSSLVAIHIERASRRPILCLYVTNVASETLFRMAVSRGWVKPIRHGEVLIFTLSMASLLFRFRGDHKDDQTFSLLRFVVGKDEERLNHSLAEENAESSETPPIQRDPPRRKSYASYPVISQALQIYSTFINNLKKRAKSPCCPHANSCLFYSLQGGCKMLATGYGIQVALRLALSIRKIIKRPSMIPKVLIGPNILNLGAFLGLFSATFRATLCSLRWLRGKDSQSHALPAGLLAGLAYLFYPESTPALYVMWKAIQMCYQELVDNGYIPRIPLAMELLYCFSTSVLFHAAFVEVESLPTSYFVFLDRLSGERIRRMSRVPFEAFGYKSAKQLQNVVESLRLDPHPLYKLEIFGRSLDKK